MTADEVAVDASPPGAVGFREPALLVRLLVTLLWIIIAVDAAAIVSTGFEVRLLGSFQQHAYTSIEAARADASANDVRQHLIGILQIGLTIVTGIIFLCWVYRANANAHRLGAAGMEDTPGWSVGWYFIPFANLWMPYQSMKEIWRASAAPADWRNHPRGVILPWWWFLFLASGVAGQVAFALGWDRHDISTAMVTAIAAMIANAIAMAAWLTTLVLVRQIHRMQLSRARPQGAPAAPASGHRSALG